MIKPELRRELRDALGALSEVERAKASEAICDSLVSHSALENSRILAVFDPLPDEPDIKALREIRSPSTGLVYPRCEGEHLKFYLVETDNDLQPVPGYRFREPNPKHCKLIAYSAIDTILVPGLAFTGTGSIRLGRGGGFYDRLLSDPELRAHKLGVCFALQLRDSLPREAHDQGVDTVITEKAKH